MSTFPIPTLETASDEVRPLFEAIKKQLGLLPNLYAIIGTSARTLKAYLGFQDALTKGSFNNKEIQGIFLAVSQANDCLYCLSAHTTLAKMNGFTEDDTFALRLASITDKRLGAITKLARSIVMRRGFPEPELVQRFFDAGFDRAALIELIALVADKTFANYVNNVVDTPIDFPVAQKIGEPMVLN